MAIPEQGGIVTGSHTIDITTNNHSGWWYLYMEVKSPSDAGDTNTNPDANLINTTQQSSTNPYTIASLPEEAVPSPTTSGNTLPLEDNTWGIAMPYGGYEDDFSPRDNYTSTDQDILKDTKWASPKHISNERQLIAGGSSNSSESRTIYYGVRVDNPSTTPAGDYQAGIVYTAIANLPPSPTITTITPNTYTIGSNDPTTITIEGTNLTTTYEVWIDLDKDTNISTNQNINPDPNEVCTNIQIVNDTKLTCTIPTPSSTLTINPDTYNLYLRTQANDLATATFTYTTPPAGTVCRNADPYSDCQVDIDDNMIPIYYDGNTENGEAIWKVANPNDTTNPGSWYDYTNKQWANAVTVKADKLADYQQAVNNKDTSKRVAEEDILGYWVYIPRYAYEVQRPNAVDRVVAPQNFNIRFETAGDTKKTPASSCNLGIKTAEQMWVTKPTISNTNSSNAGPNSTNVKAKDYRTTCVNESGGTITRDYPGNDAELANGHTTWATHPAFSWLDSEGNGIELNGIWVGKFETTGTRTNPTVKPNQHAREGESLGDFITTAKHVGVYDQNNIAGNDVTEHDGTTLNAQGYWPSLHNLDSAPSHMLNNSEWGAIAYLTASIYGAGINVDKGLLNVYPNSSDSTPYTAPGNAFGATGCGPFDETGSPEHYDDGAGLFEDESSLDACSTSNPERAYNGLVGVMASTTGNQYGIYDTTGKTTMLAGVYAAKGMYDSPYDGSDGYPPYTNLYYPSHFNRYSSPDWSIETAALGFTQPYYNNDWCTWETCGGQALHETKMYQSVQSDSSSWGGGLGLFVFYMQHTWFGNGLFSLSPGSTGGLYVVLIAYPN